MVLTFTVFGTAVPKGSTKAFGYYAKNKSTGQLLLNKHGKPILLASTSNANAKTKGWQQLVAEGASQAIQQLPEKERVLLSDAVRLTIAFHMPRPKKFVGGRYASGLRPCAHVVAPDCDKLARCVLDSLTGVCYRDDSQVVELIAQKLYAGVGEAPHCDIRVEPTLGNIVIPKDQPLFVMAR